MNREGFFIANRTSHFISFSLTRRCRGGKLAIETANVELDEECAERHIGVEPGVNFIQKPYSVEKLARKVREALDR